MSVRVLFFGATADIAGVREVTLSTDKSTAGDFLEHIVREHPRLASHKLLISINQQYVSHDTGISEGDEVAIFTAVSGG